jgi:diguanylate cyclase (GGDEF)-like protein
MRATTALLGLALDAAAHPAAAAQAVVDHLGADARLLPSVYLERGGRLRCAALQGYWQAVDGIPSRAGVVGQTYRTGSETIVADVTASPDYVEAAPGVVAELCLPVLVAGKTIGVLNVESREPLQAGDVEHLRACAEALGRRIDVLGGLPTESAAQRLLRHVAAMAALQDGEAIAAALLEAALDLVPLGSAVLARSTAADLRAVCATGPLSTVLCEARLEPLAERVRNGASCFTVGAPAAAATADLAALRTEGVESLVAVGLFVQGEMLGTLVLAAPEPWMIQTDDVELLEQLAAHAALCLRTVELVDSLRERAASDPLTGLGHHATFHEALATSHRRPRTAVVLCDVDSFKRLNDTHGHAYGDRVLCRVADAMSGALRRGDRLFRIGGDEFAALLAVGSEAEALGAAKRLHRAVEAARLGVTVSVGTAVPHDGEADASLLARADRALYAVKEGGRDGVALADGEPLPATPAAG